MFSSVKLLLWMLEYWGVDKRIENGRSQLLIKRNERRSEKQGEEETGQHISAYKSEVLLDICNSGKILGLTVKLIQRFY